MLKDHHDQEYSSISNFKYYVRKYLTEDFQLSTSFHSKILIHHSQNYLEKYITFDKMFVRKVFSDFLIWTILESAHRNTANTDIHRFRTEI